jgi:hypothetical protein
MAEISASRRRVRAGLLAGALVVVVVAAGAAAVVVQPAARAVASAAAAEAVKRPFPSPRHSKVILAG